MYSIRGGCSSESSDDSDSSSSSVLITQVTIIGVNNVSSTGTTELTANAILSGTVNPSLVTYSWSIKSGSIYVSLSSYNGSSVKLTANNTSQSAQTVTVLVIAKYGSFEKSAEKTITVKAKSSESESGNSGSTDSGKSTDSGNKSSTDSGSSAVLYKVSLTQSSYSIKCNGSATLTATPVFSSGSSEDVTYEWEITNGESYATLTANGATAVLQGKNTTSSSHFVTVRVTAEYNGVKATAVVQVYVKEFEFSVSLESESYSIVCNGSTTLKANLPIPSGSSEDVTYEWEITEGDSYATLTANGATATLQGKNSTTENQTVTVKVTAKFNDVERTAQNQIKVYLREEYSITYYKNNVSKDDEIITGLTPSTFNRTEDVDLSTAVPEKAGYTFAGWSTSGSSSDIITGWKAGEKLKKINLFAQWTANSGIKYTVNHYKENLDRNTYTLVDSETLYGTAGERTKAVAKDYEGFKNSNFSQKEIKGDGGTVVEIKYKRKYVTLTIVYSENRSENVRGYYGAEVNISSPTSSYYTFAGWSPELPSTFPAEDATFTAQWIPNSLSITASAPEYSNEDFLSLDTSDSSKITFTADADCSWYVDGDLKSSSGKTFTMSIDDYQKGYYTVMAISGKHSATVQVAVSK